MRPAEVLSLIEEAKGTSAYLQKKVQAMKTIEKKRAKLEETQRIMNEEVMPQYERLMEDKQNFDRYKEVSEAIKEKNRIYLAYDYNQLKAQVEDKDGNR